MVCSPVPASSVEVNAGQWPGYGTVSARLTTASGRPAAPGLPYRLCVPNVLLVEDDPAIRTALIRGDLSDDRSGSGGHGHDDPSGDDHGGRG